MATYFKQVAHLLLTLQGGEELYAVVASSTQAVGVIASRSLIMAISIIQYPVPQALVDAKGDIFVATADNTVGRLPIGSRQHSSHSRFCSNGWS
jgi:hypothetical protein